MVKKGRGREKERGEGKGKEKNEGIKNKVEKVGVGKEIKLVATLYIPEFIPSNTG